MAKNKTDDVRKAREQAVEALNTAVEQIRTPLLAALGAGDLATQAVVDAVNKARTRATERAEAVRDTVEEVPGDLSTLREKLDPAELRKLVENYSEAATKLYQKLADHGEDALTKFRGQPQVKKAIDQVEEAIAQLQERLGDAAGDARELTDDLLGRLTRRTRSVGEKTARAAKNLADEAAEAIEEAGDDVAHTVRSTSRKVANKTAPAKAAPKTAPKTASRGTASKATATTK
jgi:heparin binding hemagglutinin HbhA